MVLEWLNKNAETKEEETNTSIVEPTLKDNNVMICQQKFQENLHELLEQITKLQKTKKVYEYREGFEKIFCFKKDYDQLEFSFIFFFKVWLSSFR